MEAESYTPRTWRTHPLHICPPEPYSPSHPRTRECMDWIFLISSLNFSFWSDKEGLCPGDAKEGRYAVEWWSSWEEARGGRKVKKMWTGYWSLVAAINRGKQLTSFNARWIITKGLNICVQLLIERTAIRNAYICVLVVMCGISPF